MTKKINWDEKKNEILARIDIRAEVETFGLRLNGAPSSSGWISAHNPYKKDNNASGGINIGSGGQRGYLVLFNQSTNNLSESISFWDLARDFHPKLAGLDFKQIIKSYAEKTGVDLKLESKIPPPTLKDVKKYQDSITKEVRAYINNHRGLIDTSIEKYQLGWRVKDERIAYPVFNQNKELINIRFHAWKKSKGPKVFSWGSGYGSASLWGVDRLVETKEGDIICVTTGEFDSMLIEQETGLVSVSPTNGDQAFEAKWVEFFYGKHVVFICDCDLPCREAIAKKFIPAFRPRIQNGKILSLKIIWLFDDPNNKNLKDFTDYITKAGGSGESLLKKIKETEPETFPELNTKLPDPIKLTSFKEIDDPKYVGKRVCLPLYIHGENSEAYHAPTKLMVGHCSEKKKGCHGRDDWSWSCDEEIPVLIGNRIQLACVASSDFQMKGYLREFVCDKGKKPVILMEDKDRLTIREVYAHQTISGDSNSNDLVEKAVYTIGGKIHPIGQYQATGFIHSHPRNQKPTMLIDTMEAQEEDWQAFNLEQSRPLLRKLQSLNITNGHILDDLMYHVTKIYERYDIHLGVMLTLCSPKWIDFPGDGRIRGWISSVVIGDTGTGKSTISEEIFNYAGVGYRVSGMTSSRTGITYACEYDEKRGWRIKAGALLKMSGQAMIIDEAQDLAEEDLKTMAEALDRGKLKIDRIQNKEFDAETRCFFSLNPVNPKRKADQRTMGSYKYGCRAVGDIFPKMMLRRLDLILFASSHDIKNKDEIFNQKKPEGLEEVVSSENLKALIYYAWNLSPERIILPDDVVKLIRRRASSLASKFGGGEDLPIVYPEDFRKTFCRMCVACAVIDLSSDDDFETITVKPIHVEFMADQIDDIYSAKNCQLDKHAREYEREHNLINEEDVARKLKEFMAADHNHIREERLKIIFHELLRLDPENKNEKLSQAYLANLLEVNPKTIFRNMEILIKERLVISSRGYLPTSKLFQLWHYLNGLTEEDEFYNLIPSEIF